MSRFHLKFDILKVKKYFLSILLCCSTLSSFFLPLSLSLSFKELFIQFYCPPTKFKHRSSYRYRYRTRTQSNAFCTIFARRLDMCRRTSAFGECNRGTAGKNNQNKSTICCTD